MFDYLVKRVLIMIPTFLGISLLIWLIMTLAPGDPSSLSGSGAGIDQKPPEDLSNLEQGRAKRLFRTQFGLDRPRFYNNWEDLDVQTLEKAVNDVLAGAADGRAKQYKESRQALEDYGAYAVRPLIQLLAKADVKPAVRSEALRFLRQSAYQTRTIYPPGYQPTDAERLRDRDLDASNREIGGKDMTWQGGASEAAVAAVVARWQAWYENNRGRFEREGFDRVWNRVRDTQFGKYWAGVLTGDLGKSNRTREPVVQMISSRLKYSLSLAVPAFFLAWILAVLLGVFSATHHRSLWDQGLGVILFALYSIPVFVAGTILWRWFAVDLKWFPSMGFEPTNAASLSTPDRLVGILHHITLPIICYTYGALASISRFARSGMLNVLRADYVRTARAKGLRERTVVWRHAARNGMMPLVTLLGTALPVLLGGSVIIEYIFGIDGFGNLLVTSIFSKDYNVVMAIQLIVAALTLIGLLLTDLIYAAMDPRISFR